MLASVFDEYHPVTALPLGSIEGRICPFNQRFQIVGVIWKKSYPDRDGNRNLHTFGAESLGRHRLPDSFRDLLTLLLIIIIALIIIIYILVKKRKQSTHQ